MVAMITQDGRLIVIGGASRSGKTAYVAGLVKNSRRVWAWDPEDQWAQLPGWQRVTRKDRLEAAMLKRGPQKIAYVTGGDLPPAFDFWARCVMHAVRYVEPLDAVAEELADVTSASKAPGQWGMLIRRGLKRGLNLYPISQRWQEADKTAIGNATSFVFFRHVGDEAPLYLKRKTGVPIEMIPKEPLHYVEWDPATETATPGRLPFKKPKNFPEKKAPR